jgi:L-fuculose-phosphate aldolase
MPTRPPEHRLRTEIIRCCRDLFDRDFTPATSGNISVRLDAERLLITPTGMSKGSVREADLVVVDLGGHRLEGGQRPTSELDLHRAIYEVRPESEAVVHAHPPVATGFACAGIPLDRPLASEFVLALGCAPLAPYGTPGTKEVPASVRELAKTHDAILLSNHGAVTFGSSLSDAFGKMELVEHFARVALTTRLLGQEKPLAEADILKLLEAKARYFGLEKVPGREPGCPAAGAVPSPSVQGPDKALIMRIVEEALGRLH